MRKLLKLVGFLTLTGYLATMLAALIIRLLRPSRGDEDSNELDLVTAYNGLELASRAPAFRGGASLTMFGGADIDLRAATLDPAGADLTVQTIFGGTNLVVPEGWNVLLDDRTIMGGSDNSTVGDGSGEGPALRVRALTLFGGLEISSRSRRDD